MSKKRKTRGLALLDKGKLHAVTSSGGKAAHEMGKAHEWTSDEARRMGRIGGSVHKGSKWSRLK